jgi:light-regulated signal transduction histidine kinase (bacteriophytochrome)
LVGNAVLAQSGGPTAVINASMCGAIQEALKHKKIFRKLYGGKNGALVFVHDITERKREEALRGDMERIAKHDLKGPLNAVINLPLLYQDDANLTANQAEGLRLIHQAGLRMLEQIDQSLTLYRIETGSFKLAPQAVDLATPGQLGQGIPLPGQGRHRRLDTGIGVEFRLRLEVDCRRLAHQQLPPRPIVPSAQSRQ